MAKLRIISLLLMAVLLSGCSWMNPYSDVTKVNIRLNGSDYLNPDLRGRPSPVVVRIFELKNAVNFTNADFFSLYNDAKNVLGEDLVAVEEMELTPRQKIHLRYRVAETSQYVGIIAAYRDLSTATWRYVVKTVPKEKLYVNVVLTSDGIYQNTDPRAYKVNETLPMNER
ncbi:type VI secretion system lipoprotein TssJ [Entomomonas sp. E2T0]|uniref:type VI secretion system lipoprotein TssJ n=1 Tax=Entomomonas sp. E2T0 TaxID=2930213 RepID=UPI0022282381|nr:type VI secretion system lipoprotein TssJ [Entomomonas sp. E2T0]UYZ84362.1 type VI secretion system lipoprotein TssJ [Entomomonas sp. E2T0]